MTPPDFEFWINGFMCGILLSGAVAIFAPYWTWKK